MAATATAVKGEASASPAALVEAALRTAAEGWPVFPCAADKAPLTPNGFHDASTDPDAVRAMPWAAAGKVGAAVPHGYAVLDVDPRNGGDETMAALKAEGLRIPRTRVVRTGGGGTHYYFRVPRHVAALRARLGNGVDVKRAGKGYVIVPPSEGYEVLRRDAPTAMPDWLVQRLRVEQKQRDSDGAADPKFFPAFEAGTRYGLAAMEHSFQRLRDAVPGERNDSLNREAFVLAQLVAGGELAEGRTLAALEELVDGLGWDRTRATIESGWAAGLAEPVQALPGGKRRDEDDTPPPEAPAPVDDAPEDAEASLWLDWYGEHEEPEYYLEPVLPKNAFVLVYGATEASKSMAFLGLLAQASRRGHRCTVYSLENPPHVDKGRLRRLEPSRENFRLSNEPLDLGDAAQLKALVDRESAWGTRLLMIDTYSHAFSSRSEDGNARAIEFARRVRHVMHEVGCTVILIDHTGYANAEEPRDASAKRQQVDVAVFMERSGEWHPGQPAYFSMKNRKAARFGNPFFLNGMVKDVGGGLEVELTGGDVRWH